MVREHCVCGVVYLCGRVVFRRIIVGLGGPLDNGVKLEGGCDGDEGDVEDFGRHATRVSWLIGGSIERYIPIAYHANVECFACHFGELIPVSKIEELNFYLSKEERRGDYIERQRERERERERGGNCFLWNTTLHN